jgi:outer membrane immunogenic protein
MRMKFGGGIGVLAAMVASVGAAGAADLAPVYTKAPPMFISDWAGFYLGVHGGYGWGDSKLELDDFPFNQKGGLFGGHAGYNWQYGSVVTGLEIDFDGANIKDTFEGEITAKTSALASARARLGYTLWPNLLAYGTAGAAWAHTNISEGSSVSAVNQFGWVAGAGLEYKFNGNNWIARAEYLHYDFDKTDTNFGVPFSQTIDVVRGGLSYKF